MIRNNGIALEYEAIPEIVNGYELTDIEISILLPEETVNLITNPSFELAVTGYTAVNSALARVTTWQRRGAYGLRITPNAGTEAGVYFGTVSLTAGQWYTFSVDFQGDPGKTYNLYFASTAPARLATNSFIASGFKERIYVKYYETSSTTRRLYLTRNSYTDTNVFYTDGWQLENKSYATSYCDGDMAGFLVGEKAYLWNGARHASTSWRNAATRSGGKPVKLKDLGFVLMAIVGLGMAPVGNVALPSSMGGAHYQDTIEGARQFSLVGTIQGSSQAELKRIRSDLIDTVKPDVTARRQPLVMQYREVDGSGNQTTESLEIVCLYNEGLQGATDNNHQERLGLQFNMYLPMIREEGELGSVLGFTQTVANANNILVRDADGAWQAMGTGANGSVTALALGQDGSIYVGGYFSLAGGVADTAYVARWTGTVWESLGTGMGGAVSPNVTALAVAPDGSVYAAGNFTTAGGVAANYVAKYSGGVWSALGSGLNGSARALAIGHDGYLYVGGYFTLAGGIAGTAYIARWTGIAWQPLSTGGNNDVYAIAIGPDGTLYAGGLFTLMGGIAGTQYVAKWTGTAWLPMDAGFDDGSVLTLAIGRDGKVFAGGTFTTARGEQMNYVSYFTGSHWNHMAAGVNDWVDNLYTLSDGSILAGGKFTQSGTLVLFDRTALWNGSVWLPIDVNLPGTPEALAVLEDHQGNLYIGFNQSGSAVSAIVTVPNIGSASTYPKVIFTGPGKVAQLKNYTSKKAIYFNLTLLDEEVAILDLDPRHYSFSSNFRANLRNSILPGSDEDLELLPGTNNISTFIYGTTDAGTGVVMTWKDQYWSLDGAVR